MESVDIKKPLYSFNELKEKAKNIEKNSIDDYLYAFKYYVWYMNLNYLKLLEKQNNIHNGNYIKEFLRLMFTLIELN